MDLRLGKLAPDPTRRALLLGPHLRAVAPAPETADWLSQVRRWPMYGNDRYGDCVWAMIGHAIEAWTSYAGKQLRVSTQALLRGYHEVTGFTPNDPASDQGTVMQEALDYWRVRGVAGHKILAFAKVDHTDAEQLRQAIAIFGALMVGINFPASAMTQFRARQPWALAHPDGGIEGGHAIHLGRYSPQDYDVTTWGRVQRMTLGFADRYVDEAWAVISPEWLTAAGKSPSGLDLAGLGEEMTALTGQPDPFRLAV